MTALQAGAAHPAAAENVRPLLLWLFGAACGLLIANVYYAQPLTGVISAALHMPRQSAGLIVTLPLVGYGLGLLLIVPLGDLVENRRLILVLIGLEAGALLLISLVSSAAAFLAIALLIGLTASSVQVILPYISHLTPERARGQVLGRLVSGIMLGIMLARPVSSLVADVASWRMIFRLSAAAMGVLVIAIRAVAPRRSPVAAPSYVALIRSMGGIFRQHEILRRRALYHAAMFGAFSAFWTAVPLWLSGAPFHLSQRGVALVALAGVAGAAAPPLAGRLADKGLARPATVAAMLLAAASFLLSDLAPAGSRAGLVLVTAAAVLLDFAVSANMVLGQRAIYALGAEQRSRINALFMATFFAGGALASASSGWVFANCGWIGVSVLGAGFPLAALIYVATERRGD
jgi:predicted MFS family arabinose efflux permease